MKWRRESMLSALHNEGMEACPECGKESSAKEILNKGYSYCEWKSRLRKNKEQRIKLDNGKKRR
jgi:hypothetical protein